MPDSHTRHQHAALWLIGPDMPGLLNKGATFVARHNGNIDKDIADKFGEKAVVFMSITAHPDDIDRMSKGIAKLKEASGGGVVFQPMNEPIVPDGYRPDLYGFEMVTEDSVGLIAEVTALVASFGMMIIGHTGERQIVPGPRHEVRSGQKFIVMLPTMFDQIGFASDLTALVRRHKGKLATPLRVVPGLLWWW